MNCKRPHFGFTFLFILLISFPTWSSDKVILVSFDGFMNSNLQKYLPVEFKDKGLGRILKEGTIANGMMVTLPSLTAVSHMSIVTGVAPSVHGIVSNLFSKVTDPLDFSQKGTNGFETQWDPRAKTLWEIAKAKGKTVGVIAFPGADGKTEIRSGHWGVQFVNSEYHSFILDLTRANFASYPRTLPDTLKSYSDPLIADLSLLENAETPQDADLDNHHGGGVGLKAHSNNHRRESSPKAPPTVNKHNFKVIALDSTDDHVTNYDQLIFDDDGDVTNGHMSDKPISVTQNPWVGLKFYSGDILKGSWCKVLQFQPDLSQVKIYVGALHATKAYPPSFRNVLYKEVGFWPGAPDRSNETVSEELVLEQAIRFSEFFKRATLVAAQTQKWDVILSYQPMLDELEHAFYMIDPSQPNYTKEKSDRFLSIIRRGYLQANDVIDEWIRALPDTNFVFVSDHGMAPIHTEYFPNRALKKAGYIDGSLKAHAFTSGGLAHVYLNLVGRNPSGTIAQSEFAQTRTAIMDLFRKETAIESVYTREETESLGLNHPDSGDIILVAKPGYQLGNDLGDGETQGPATFYGQHGYDPNLASMKAIFAAIGPKVKKEGLTAETQYKEVLPFILRILNLTP